MSEKVNIYNRDCLSALKRLGMKIKGAKMVSHLYPRAYCIAKPAPGCAVLIRPPADSGIEIFPECSGDIIWEGATEINVGDWCATAYVVEDTRSQSHIFTIAELEKEIQRGKTGKNTENKKTSVVKNTVRRVPGAKRKVKARRS